MRTKQTASSRTFVLVFAVGAIVNLKEPKCFKVSHDVPTQGQLQERWRSILLFDRKQMKSTWLHVARLPRSHRRENIKKDSETRRGRGQGSYAEEFPDRTIFMSMSSS